MANTTSNRDQIEYWNGPRGDFWVTAQETRDQELAYFGERALEEAALQPGERVIDVGCGCGATTLALAGAVGHQGKVLGIDVSKAMLARAKARAADLAQVSFELADAATFSFEERAGRAFFALRRDVLRRPAERVREPRAGRRTGGQLTFVCWRSLVENAWMNVAWEAVRPIVPAARATPPPEAPGPLAFADSSRVRQILEDAGFAAVTFQALDCPMPLGGNRGLDAAAADALTVGPTSRLLNDATAEVRSLALSTVKKALEPYARGNVVQLAGAAWLVSARAG